MSINLQELKDEAGRKLMASGTSFDQAFMECVNNVTHDLTYDCFIEDLESVDDLSQDTGAADKYKQAYKLGTMYYLQSYGMFAKKSELAHETIYRRELARCQTMSLEDIDPAVGTPDRST